MPDLKPRLLPWTQTRRTAVRLLDLPPLPFVAGAAALGLVLSVGLAAVAGPFDGTGQRKAEAGVVVAQEAAGGADHGPAADSGAPSAPPVLPGVGEGPRAADAPAGRQLADVLKPLLADRALGSKRAVSVVDAGTGRQVFGRNGGLALTPASTTKIATAVAVLSARGADHRLTTRTVLGPGSRVTLVGGGDPTLTARAEDHGAASLRALAADTAKALRAADVREVSLAHDSSLFAGKALHPIGPNENLAPVAALMADQGRLDDSAHGTAPRSTDPAADAAEKFARFLSDEGVRVKGAPKKARSPKDAAPLASVSSQPMSALVERMLTHSDNDIAEALARQVALAGRTRADLAGAGRAIHDELTGLALPTKGARFADGSGLARADRLSADLLTGLLAAAADPEHPELRSVLTGLPVAGFTGTLHSRYGGGGTGDGGTGLVRAKTGTLTGVNTLAGTVVDKDGRLLLFAFMTSGSTAPADTQKALDRLASALAACGCR